MRSHRVINSTGKCEPIARKRLVSEASVEMSTRPWRTRSVAAGAAWFCMKLKMYCPRLHKNSGAVSVFGVWVDASTDGCIGLFRALEER